MYVIKLENTVTHQIHRFESEDMNNGSKLYYEFNVNTLELEDGEYILTLCDSEDNVLSEDVLRIGDFTPQTLQYKAGGDTYIAIEFDAKLGPKEAQIEETIANIYPDGDYNGMTYVKVDATAVYENGKNEGVEIGYSSGYGQGMMLGVATGEQNQKAKLESITITENGTYTREDGYNVVQVEVPDLNGSYDDGYGNGYESGKSDVVNAAEEITITENGTYGNGETLYKTINVKVQNTKIDIAEAKMTFAYSTMETVPSWADFSNVTDMTRMFYECNVLQNFNIDTSGVVNMSYAFYSCKKLKKEEIAQFNTSNVTDMSAAFYGCTFDEFPSIDTSNVTKMKEMFASTHSTLRKVNPIDTSKVTDMMNMFYNFSGEYALEELPEFDCTNVTNMAQMFSYYQDKLDNFTTCGGWKNLKCKWDDNYGLRCCANLSYQSCINILNGLYDFTGNGKTATSNQGKLKVHQNFLDTVGDEISIGTNKGWTITV